MGTIAFKKLSDKAIMPKMGRLGDAWFDLYGVEDCVLAPFSTALVKTNIAMEIPEGYFGKVFTRSGMALKGFSVDGGVIDSNYRGDIGVILRNTTDKELTVSAGDRVAQLVILKVDQFVLEEVEELSDTVRGDAGYGSSGK